MSESALPAGDSISAGSILVPMATDASPMDTEQTADVQPTFTEAASQRIEPSESNSITNDVVVVNAAAAKKPKKKRSSKKKSTAATRQEQAEVRATAIESILDAVEAPPPTMVTPKAAPASRALYSSARDVWFWMRPVDSTDEVRDDVMAYEVERDRKYQDSLQFSTLRHPKSLFLRCICCLRTARKTQVWANRNGGLTSCLRDHLEKYHPVSYYGKCQQEGLTERCANKDEANDTQPEWSHAGLVDRLVDLVVSNDEPISLVDRPELRDLVLFCGQGRIREQDIPHRDKLATAAWAMYLLEKGKIDDDMKATRGRISLTSDLWSDPNQRSFMAVTAHYINEQGRLQDHLISFRKIDGEHTGANISNALFRVLQESDIVGKVGWITLDNATNNNTLMEELAATLGQYGASFHPEHNRIRCFPHIMNLGVQAIITALEETAAMFRAQSLEDDLPIDNETQRYLQALDAHPIELVRKSIHSCRSSGQRREGLRNAIVEGNRLGRFRAADGAPYLVPVLQLLRDVPTRWSSTYNMLGRYIALYPALADYAFRSRHEFQLPIVSHKQYEVIQDVHSVLTLAHNAQELLSAEKTPTLALAFPVYETVLEGWEQLCITIPELSHAITCGIQKVREYIDRTQDVPVHALGMIINPSLKLGWIQENWTPSQVSQAEETIKAEMLHFQRASGVRARVVGALNGASRAAQAQNSGYMRLLTAGTTLRRASSLRSDSSSSEPAAVRPRLDYQANTPSLPTAGSSGSIGLSSANIQSINQAKVDAEFARYIEDGIIPVEDMGAVELAEFWRDHQYTYPLLYQIAMDVLPVQASSVSSERVFSSSKLTCTAARNRITPENMEYLQVLKHALHRRRRGQGEDESNGLELDFVSHKFENLALDYD